MTVSLRNSFMRWFLAFALLLSAPLHAQEESAEGQTEDSSEQLSEETSAESAAKKPRTLYYIGDRPALKRQEGPPVGKPLSIIPQPYVPQGSITVPTEPPAPESDAESEAEEGAEDSADAALPTDTEVTPVDEAEDDATSIDMLPNAEETFLEAGSLTALDPSTLAVLPQPEALPRDFWQGYSRADIIKAFRTFERAGSAPTKRAIARKVALSGFALPASENREDVLAFLSARLDLLAQIGDAEGYKALLARLPAGEEKKE